MELSASVAGPEAPVRPGRPLAAAAPRAVGHAPRGEGRAIASFTLTILALLTALLSVPVTPLLALLGLMLATDAWEDIERDPMRSGRNLAMATFWIIGVACVLGLLVGLGSAIFG